MTRRTAIVSALVGYALLVLPYKPMSELDTTEKISAFMSGVLFSLGIGILGGLAKKGESR